jgi:hypothetical protein
MKFVGFVLLDRAAVLYFRLQFIQLGGCGGAAMTVAVIFGNGYC